MHRADVGTLGRGGRADVIIGRSRQVVAHGSVGSVMPDHHTSGRRATVPIG
jgi:hypothetical protein